MLPENSPLECRRCGTCCRKGGPGLHLGDLPLYVSGRLPRAGLLTLRAGELVFDNVAGNVGPLAEEMVKIRSVPGGACVFFRDESRCAVYRDRPAECRALFCAAPEAVASMYQKDRLTRRDLIQTGGALIDLIMYHEQRCAQARAAELARALESGDEAAGKELFALVRFDEEFRAVLVERAGIDPSELPFYLGRPLAETLIGRGPRCETLFASRKSRAV